MTTPKNVVTGRARPVHALYERISELSGVPVAGVTRVINALPRVILEELHQRRSVSIPRFLRFNLVHVNERVWNAPHGRYLVPERLLPKVRMSDRFRRDGVVILDETNTTEPATPPGVPGRGNPYSVCLDGTPEDHEHAESLH